MSDADRHMDAGQELRILAALFRAEKDGAEVENLTGETFASQYCGEMQFVVKTEVGPIRVGVFNDCDEFDYLEWIELDGKRWHFPMERDDGRPMMTEAIAHWKPWKQADPRWGEGTW